MTRKEAITLVWGSTLKNETALKMAYEALSQPTPDEIIDKIAKIIADEFADCRLCQIDCLGRKCHENIALYLREKVLE